MTVATNPIPVPSVTRLNAGLTLLRVLTGVTFAAHGAQKFFQFGLAGVTESFAGMGVPFPGLAAPIVAGIELVGGLALVVGFFTPIAASLLALTMLGAIMLVHLPNGFFAPAGIELPLALFGAAAFLVSSGGGRWSVDGFRTAARSH